MREGHCRWSHPWAGGPGLYKKAGKASHEEQANKQLPSMASASAPASRFLLCVNSFLTSSGDKQRGWGISWIRPSLPNLLSITVFTAAIETLTKTVYSRFSLPFALKAHITHLSRQTYFIEKCASQSKDHREWHKYDALFHSTIEVVFSVCVCIKFYFMCMSVVPACIYV